MPSVLPYGAFSVVPALGDRLSDREMRVALALERMEIWRFIAPGGPIRVRVVAEHPARVSIEAGHAEWTPTGLGNASTPEGLPRRRLDETPPRPVVQVELERVDALSGGMSSHYGYRGYFLSLLLWLDEAGDAVIWDARGEPAS